MSSAATNTPLRHSRLRAARALRRPVVNVALIVSAISAPPTSFTTARRLLRPYSYAVWNSSGMPVSANTPGCWRARAGLTRESGSSRCSIPATAASGSKTQTAMQLPIACVVISPSPLATTISPIPTTWIAGLPVRSARSAPFIGRPGGTRTAQSRSARAAGC
jgi:hypothetical protein